MIAGGVDKHGEALFALIQEKLKPKPLPGPRLSHWELVNERA